MIGWICSYRQIWESDFFKGNGMRVAIWHWMLHHAAWENTTHNITGVTVPIKRGEVCFSQEQITKDTGATRKQIRAVIDYVISTKSAVKIGANTRANVRANAKTILHLVKYDNYQNKKEPRANGRDTKGPTKEQVNNIPVGALPKSLKEIVFSDGVDFLQRSGVKSPRPMIGKWVSQHGEGAVIEALGKCQREGALDVVSYMEGVFRFTSKQKSSKANQYRSLK